MIVRSFLLVLFSAVCFQWGIAKENLGQTKLKKEQTYKALTDCNEATSDIDLDINNVRTRLLGGGDFWWDLSVARYEVPRIPDNSDQPSVSSLFAGAVWIGGFDENNQLKVAAQTYRQSGSDFWPGPLDENGSINQAVCDEYDRHWKVEGSDISEFIQAYENGNIASEDNVPASIREWPGRDNPWLTDITLPVGRDFAPFFDNNQDGIYNPVDGDYPTLDTSSAANAEEGVYADQMIWWIYNDRGNLHSESGGVAIGIEVHALAFAFKTNDERNNMTFYRYRLINKATSELDSTFMGIWVDADLGGAYDDYVGCDTSRNLGICYNGRAFDADFGSSRGYGDNPPIIGVDYFQGPIVKDTTSTGADTSIELGMSSFLFYNNDFTITGNPTLATSYYGYMAGTWQDGSPFLFRGNGHSGGGGITSQPSNFMFPSDPTDQSSTAWSECNIDGSGTQSTPADRRFLQSSGPFVLEPGAVNDIIVGVAWVRPTGVYPCPPFSSIQAASDKAQVLFDSNFEIVDGPDAPNMSIRELNKELIISLWNDENSNNMGGQYNEVDATITAGILAANDVEDQNYNPLDTSYKFQGYIVYQLKNSTVTSVDFGNPDLARVIGQVDVKDDIASMINYNFDPEVGVETPTLEVSGNNEGITHTFKITTDAFAEGESQLINYKKYYFSVIAYASNNYLPYDPSRRDTNDVVVTGQTLPFLAGRQNIRQYTAIPHDVLSENDGTKLNASYGDGPEITLMDGIGNGGNLLEFTAATESQLLQFGAVNTPTYTGTKGPVKVTIFDPLKLPADNFKIVFDDTTTGSRLDSGATWHLERESTGEVYNAANTIGVGGEEIFIDLGLSVEIKQVLPPGFLVNPVDRNTIDVSPNNGFISDDDAVEPFWLNSLPDQDVVAPNPSQGFQNWIRSGTFTQAAATGEYNPSDISYYNSSDSSRAYLDPEEIYENVVEGTWAPFVLASQYEHGPGLTTMLGVYALSGTNANRLDSLHSVMLVFTPDKSKWSRCPVVETGDNQNINEGQGVKLGIRQHAGLNLDGTYSSDDPSDDNYGMGWFPGYAMDLETGNRLNVMYGESSWLVGDNGRDMIWNPTSRFTTSLGEIKLGGKHYIYIMRTPYDRGEEIREYLESGGTQDKNRVYKQAMWTSVPVATSELVSFSHGIVPEESRIRIGVNKSYKRNVITGDNNGLPLYSFSTHSLAPTFNYSDTFSTILDEINIVPNPYYSFSKYEESQLDNRVKITNLPGECTISIFTVDGSLVRKFNRDDATVDKSLVDDTNVDVLRNPNGQDWDLKNYAGVPVASGVYIIHIDAPGIGERTLKWMGIMRPTDLDSF